MPACAWIGFVFVQVLDGALTGIGVRALGLDVEANPLLSWYIAMFGPVVALTGAKAFALACGALLHLQGRHTAVAVLTLFYAAAAIVPWVRLLTAAAAL